jgi:hypothetical protein
VGALGNTKPEAREGRESLQTVAMIMKTIVADMSGIR